MSYRQLLRVAGATALAVAVLSTSMSAALSNFQADVATAIDRGLTWLATAGAFNNPSAAGDASGLVLEALLEKRPSGIPTDPPQGYHNSTPVDQGRERNVAIYEMNATNAEGAGFYAYRDGARMFALTEYAVTQGPDKSVLGTTLTLKQTMDMLVDRTLANQEASNGFWCYTNNGCEDSSTTQFAAAGLNAARVFYQSAACADSCFADAGRAASISTALAKTKTGYETTAAQGSDNASCNVINPTERGHGYRTGNVPSLQQTASGIYIQQFGGSDVNTPMVQNYMQWEQNRYRYTDLDSMGNSWPTLSYGYFLWSSFKGMELIRQSGVPTNVGNIGPNDMGILPAGVNAPGNCEFRQTNKDPSTVAQPVSFGANGVGWYSAEPKSQYFDYASSILSYQCTGANAGQFICNLGGASYWEQWSNQAYQLLVLLRATGNAIQKCDVNGDGRIDSLDIALIRSSIGQVPLANDVRDANNDGKITMLDVRQCTLVCTSANCATAP